ncbi:MAG: helix-turn-helix domain-containing protein [Chloroflexi bacterium]|nr:helix-turn-helix domain-containing protein [Chloroflexota bacterium]
MTTIHEQYVTVATAAELLRVSTSTLWRWINQGALPAYRFGQRRVLIKREDLDRLLGPAREQKGGDMLEKERARLSRPLTQREKDQALAALDAARQFKHDLLARRGNKPFPDSTDLIRAMREERTDTLS